MQQFSQKIVALKKIKCAVLFTFILEQLCAKESPVLFREMGTENECMQTKMMSTTSKTITTYIDTYYIWFNQ